MDENNNMVESEGISLEDIIKLCKRFWEKRKFILYVCGAFVVLGFLAAIFQKPVYTSSCILVPQESSKSSSSSLSSLAAMAGLDLSSMSSSAKLSPLIYPKLLQNTELCKELIRVPLHFKKWDEPVSLLDLATDPKYRKFSLIGTIKKYTIGLPGVIMGLVRGEQSEISIPGEDGDARNAISIYTKDEYKVARNLDKIITMSVEKKEGYLTLSCKMGEAIPCAELCQATYDLLQKYISNFKIQYAASSRDYVQKRYDEAKAEYEEKQLALARFTDSNHGAMTATATIRREQLMGEYNLAYTIYTELSKQLLQSEMKVKEDTPVLSAVEPVTVPMKKSNSRSKTLIVWTFFGAVLAFGGVWGLDFLKSKGLKNKWLDKWE